MSSFVYFKFKSQKEPTRVTIDGPHTDVWNLKREIINISRLGDGTDFDLKIYKENSNEEYTDDTEIIPKDSTVLARRLPAAAPGKGRAARYVSGKPPVSAKPSTNARAGTSINMDSNMTEEERLKAMLKMTDAQWQQKQEEMSHETRVSMPGKSFPKKANVPDGEPPHGYICFRCMKKGHWIQACPTNDDSNFDGKPRIKRTTGIPRSMLKKVDQSEFDNLDEAQKQNVMVNAEGEYVLAQTDEKAWKKFQEQQSAAEAALKNVQVGNKELRERGLECSIDHRLFVDPMKTPCCGRTYCHDCIENALIDNDLTCPGCQTPNVSLEQLEPDEDMKKNIKEFQEESKDTKSPAASAGATPKPDNSENDTQSVTHEEGKSPESTGSSGGKKRNADEADVNVSDKLAAPAMKRQRSGESNRSTPQPDTQPQAPSNDQNMPVNMMPPDLASMMQNMQNMPNMGMNFPMMPFMPNMMNPGMMNMMPNMGFMPPNFNMMNDFQNGSNNSSQNMNGNWNNNNHNHRGNFGGGGQGCHQNNFYRNKPGRTFHSHNNFQNQQPQQNQNQPPDGLANVPKGPKAMQSGPSTQSNIPTGPAAGKFSNQQRHTGNEEDNAYMRQPVNPHRANRGRGRMRQADYREL